MLPSLGRMSNNQDAMLFSWLAVDFCRIFLYNCALGPLFLNTGRSICRSKKLINSENPHEDNFIPESPHEGNFISESPHEGNIFLKVRMKAILLLKVRMKAIYFLKVHIKAIFIIVCTFMHIVKF